MNNDCIALHCIFDTVLEMHLMLVQY